MIHLHQLNLDGWLSYKTAQVPLDAAGVTRIEGEVGAGKSAILEAIYYLLFGKTLRKKDSVNSLANKVLKNGYDISLTFSIDNNQYKVREVRDRADKGLYFTKNDQSLRGKTDPDTRKLILKEVGMTAAEFRSISFLGQRQTQLLVEGDEGERAQALVDIFGLNKYDELIDRCSLDIKTVVDSKKQQAEQLDRYTKEFEQLEQALIVQEDPQEIINPIHLVRILDSIKTVRDKLDRLTSKADSLNKAIGKYAAIDRQREHIEKIKKHIVQLTEELAECTKPTEKQSELERNLRTLEIKHAQAQQRYLDAKNKIENAVKLTDTCPITEEPCPVHVPHKHGKEIIHKCKLEKLTAEKEIIELGADLKTADEAFDEAALYNQICTSIVTETDVLNKFGIGDDIPDVSTYEKKLNKYKKYIQLGNTRLQELQNEQNRVQTALAILQERESMQKKVNQALEDKETAIQKLKQQIEEKSLEAQYLAGVLAVFKKMKMYKIDLVLQLLNTHLKDILNRISDGAYTAEFVSQKQSADKKKVLDKIGILVYDNNMVLPIELCSGGQSTEAGLAVLLSVWKTANTISQKGVSSLWLDEVFGPLHEDVVNRVFDSVINIIKELGTTSVKIISHRDLDSRIFDHFWYIKRKNGISTIKVV